MLSSDTNLDFSFLKDIHPPKKIGRQAKTLINRKFNRLTPLGLLGITEKGAKWLCRCDCGKFSIPYASKLLQGSTGSCGCFSHERLAVLSRSHGMTRTRIYRLWCDMLTRATNPRYKQAKDYSARGITVSERWRSFENFLEDMGQPPTPQHSIERRDNNQGYSPDNCYWATKKIQARNTRANRYLTIRNETYCLAEWAERQNLKPQIVWRRLKSGWTAEEAVGLIVKER